MAADYMGREDGNSNSATREVPVASGATVTSGDFVTLADGRATAASIAGARLLGVVQGGDSRNPVRTRGNNDQGLTATGDADGTVQVLVNQEPSARYLVEATATLAATDEGKYFNLQGNTGEQLVTATADADNGQLVLVKANPGIRGTGDTYGVFRIADSYAVSEATV